MQKKTIYVLILLIISVALLIRVGFLSDRGVHYDDLCVEKSTYRSIKERKQETKFDDVELVFEGYPLFYDRAGDRYFYSLVEKSSISYNPKIETNGYQIVFESCPISDELIADDEHIKFLLISGDKFHEYELVCTSLPLMSIDYEGNEFFYDDQPMSMKLYDNRLSVDDRLIESVGNVRLRGIFTAGLDKVGVRLTLLKNDWWTKNHQDLLGMRFDEDWILYAGYNDQDKIRNVFTAKLWNDSCATNNTSEAVTGMEYKYLELFINGDYSGLYALGYPIDDKQLNVKKTDAVYQPFMREFEEDITYERYEEVCENMRLKSGSQWDILIDYYETLFDAYENKDVETIKKIIDLDNSIDEYLFINVIQGDENAVGTNIKNMKVCIKKINGKYRCIYIPWDFDMSWGNSVDYDSLNNTVNYADDYTVNVYHNSSPAKMLMDLDDQETFDKYYGRYKYLRHHEWSDEYINNIIDQYESDIFGSGAYYREMARWPNGSYMDGDYNLDRFKTFVINRLHYLDNKIIEE